MTDCVKGLNSTKPVQ